MREGGFYFLFKPKKLDIPSNGQLFLFHSPNCLHGLLCNHSSSLLPALSWYWYSLCVLLQLVHCNASFPHPCVSVCAGQQRAAEHRGAVPGWRDVGCQRRVSLLLFVYILTLWLFGREALAGIRASIISFPSLPPHLAPLLSMQAL